MPGNPNPRTLADLVQADGMSDAVDLRQQGYSGVRLRDRLSRLFPNAFPQSIRALADRSIGVIQSIRRLVSMDFSLGGELIQADPTPGAPPGVTVTWSIDQTFPGSTQTTALRVDIEHAETLTVGQIQDQGRELLSQVPAKVKGSPERFLSWLEEQRVLAEGGDAAASERLRENQARIIQESLRISSVIRGS